jgi:hypothetical protein
MQKYWKFPYSFYIPLHKKVQFLAQYWCIKCIKCSWGTNKTDSRINQVILIHQTRIQLVCLKQFAVNLRSHILKKPKILYYSNENWNYVWAVVSKWNLKNLETAQSLTWQAATINANPKCTVIFTIWPLDVTNHLTSNETGTVIKPCNQK